MITAKQIRSAIAVLEWNYDLVSEKLGVSTHTLRGVLAGKNKKVGYNNKLQAIFELEGLEFLEHNGVRERPSSSVQTLEGQEGYWQFYDDVYETLKNSGGEVLVSNVNEEDFTKWLGEKADTQKNRMIELSKIQNFKSKILVKEGDRNLTVPEFAEYRWTPKERFSEIPFYVYGEKLAIILFDDNNVSIHIIDSKRIRNAYKKQFDVIWDQAIHIPKNNILDAD